MPIPSLVANQKPPGIREAFFVSSRPGLAIKQLRVKAMARDSPLLYSDMLNGF
jgi:hypothetical protein